MSFKQIIGATALSFFDLLGINDKIKSTRKNKRKNYKKKNSKGKSSVTQLNFFNSESGGPNENTSPTTSSKTSPIQETLENKNIESKKTGSSSNPIQFSLFGEEFAINTNSSLCHANHLTKNIRVENIRAENYKITAADKLGEGSLRQKCLDNIIAIETMKKIEKSNRKASKEDQKKLVRFVGWGGLSQSVFASKIKNSWKMLSKKIKILLSDKEYAEASRSSLTAFYTPKELINFMYHALAKIGFTGGRILEPSCGTGHFLGCMPEKLRDRTKITAVELDSISARIAALLYPNSKIYNKGFEKCEFEDESFDCIIGNIPFGNFKVYDKRYSKLNFKIHNYFFAKSLDLLREGGIVAFITSHYTMDSTDASVRKYISKRSNLIAAVRLPNSAFKSADTQTVTDIIFLQKKSENSKHTKTDWLEVKENNGIKVNEYFINHPEMIMGKLGLSKNTNQYGQYEMTVESSGKDISKLLNSILKFLPKNIYDEIESSSAYLFEEDELLSINDYPEIKENAYEVIEDKLYKRHGKKLVPILVNNSTENKIRGLIGVKKALEDTINFQMYNSNDTGLKTLQDTLNSIYDSFVRNFKHINSLENKRAFEEDPSYPLLSSLEVQNSDGSFSKADIFSKRTIPYQSKITHADSIEDALAISLNTNLKIDFKYISQLVDKSIPEVKDYLLDNQYIFKNPTTKIYETADEYLSGAVVEKLKVAKESNLRVDKEFKHNVTALSKVQPVPLNFTDIDVKLGSSWVIPKYIKQFIAETLEIDEINAEKFDVLYCNINATWEINIPKTAPSINNYKNYSEYGTERISALKLLGLSLNLKDAKIYDKVYDSQKGDYVRKLNRKESVVARQKQSELKIKFKDWIWQDKQRRTVLTNIYNDLFNSWVNRKFDGTKFEPQGLSVLAPKLRDYQKNAILRTLHTGNTLLAHAVGSGKTMEMVVSGMEMKRLGLCKKNMYVVPNSLVESGQFSREFMQLYPTAKILVATSKDFSADKRKKFVSRIALNDWDAVIIGHSSFGLIPVSNQTQEKFIREEIFELVYALNSLPDKKSRTAKQLEKTKISLEEKMQSLADTPKDNLITFEQLGVDQLYIDECHNYKRLFLYSKLRNIAGIPTSSSNKAFDMYMKIQYLINKNKEKGMVNRGAVFSTGTPISNSMAEMYVLQKYLMGDELKRLNLYYFDAWASTFGEVISSIEISPTGDGYKSKLRFAKFHNVPELMSIFGKIADIVTSDKLKLKNLPKFEYVNEEISKCPEIEDYIQTLIDRADAINKGEVKPDEDNMLCVVNDGKKAALDPRLVGINVDYDDSKINTCIRNVYNIWNDTAADRATQIIFCDLGTPKGKRNNSQIKTVEEMLDNTSFNVYEDIKYKLIKMGVPSQEIAFIHDFNTPVKKSKLFMDFRAGNIRILLGSTAKCGEGCNIQDRIIAIHHLDCPWRPSDLTQRDGRGIRVGNLIAIKHGKISIFRYATKGTFDGFSWQTIETKAKFISQVMNGNFKGRSIEDIDEQLLSFSQMKAICSENPLIAEKIKNDVEIQKLQALEAGFNRQKHFAEMYIENNQKYIEEKSEILKNLREDIKLRDSNKKSKFSMIINNIEFKEHVNEDGNMVTGKKDAGQYILKLFKNLSELDKEYKIGSFNDFEVYAKRYQTWESYIEKSICLVGSNKYYIDCGELTGLGLIQRAENKLEALEEAIEKIEKNIALKKSENIGYKETLTKTFESKEQLVSLQKRQAKIEAQLDLKTNNSDLDFNEESSEENLSA